jgi:hypothetical protein
MFLIPTEHPHPFRSEVGMFCGDTPRRDPRIEDGIRLDKITNLNEISKKNARSESCNISSNFK